MDNLTYLKSKIESLKASHRPFTNTCLERLLKLRNPAAAESRIHDDDELSRRIEERMKNWGIKSHRIKNRELGA